MMRFQDKVVIVTGGTRGVGKLMVLRFAREGAKVAFCARTEGEATELVGELTAGGTDAFFGKADIADRSQISSFVRAVEQRFGRVDILINNAGWGSGRAYFVNSDEALTDREIDINLKGPLAVTKAVLPGMMERRSGKIVFISSEAGRVGTPQCAVYSAAKGGIIAFTKALAREVARYQINVNTVAPGYINTHAHSSATSEQRASNQNKMIPLGRIAEPEEVVASAAFLASDEAAYITGQTLSVSGGLTML